MSSNQSEPRVRPVFWHALIAVVILVVGFVAAVQVFGNPLGGPCHDSYSCQGFLIGGAECVEQDSARYCTRYCDTDADCPAGWRCRDAHPTVLTIETRWLDPVCIRPAARNDVNP